MRAHNMRGLLGPRGKTATTKIYGQSVHGNVVRYLAFRAKNSGAAKNPAGQPNVFQMLVRC